MAYIPRIKIAMFTIKCSSLRQDIITGGQEYIKLGTKKFCFDCAGEKLTNTARQNG